MEVRVDDLHGNARQGRPDDGLEPVQGRVQPPAQPWGQGGQVIEERPQLRRVLQVPTVRPARGGMREVA